jgi:predicted ATPase/class 3 adenylate cyclase
MGTVTLLFSDIEGSTVLLRRLGSRWGEALSAQRAILRAAFAAYNGTEMGTEGDSFFVVFGSARDGVGAAIAGQRGLREHKWPDGVELRVRMGIHTGEPIRHEDGYIGEDVHRAARIGSTANGGQIVLSAATRRLLGELPGATLRDLGHHRLKDLPGTDQLFDVRAPGLFDDFRALRSLGRAAALPAWTTPLIGRDADLRLVLDLIADPTTRLVTLTGPGGCGKTRLAATAAAAVEPSYGDVYFVGLSAVTDADTMWTVIGQTLDVGADEVVTQLHERRALLVLDNLEQIPAADLVVSTLLSGAPGIDVLAASRRPLLLVGEREYPLQPLELPRSMEFDDTVRSPAVTMFARQAAQARPSFRVSPDNHAAVAELCRQLDGLPLALELAASQIRLLSPSALLARVDGRLGTDFAAADRPSRQRTLHDMIAWSYNLLTGSEQLVLRRLSVFTGSVDMNAITSVAGADGHDTLDVLAGLVGASMVRVSEGPDGEPRIGMLETIRRFAAERSAEAGDDTRMRHLDWCLDTVEQTVPMLRGNLHTVALDRLHAIDDEIRAALRFGLEPGDSDRIESGRQLLIAVTTQYWYLFGNVAEARIWQERALAASDQPNVGLLYGLGISMLQQNVLPESIELFGRALDMARRLDDPEWQARILNVMAVARRQAGEFTESMELLNSSIAISREIGNSGLEAKSLGNLVVLYHDLGDYPRAVRAAEQSLRVNTARGDNWAVAIDRVNYVAAILKAEGATAAAARIAEWLPAIIALGETELIIDAFELGGAIAAGLTQPRAAAQLLAAADARRARMTLPRTNAETGRIDEWLGPVRAELTPEEWASARTSGEAMTSEAAVELVRGWQKSRV